MMLEHYDPHSGATENAQTHSFNIKNICAKFFLAIHWVVA